jgi:hypothetical protein
MGGRLTGPSSRPVVFLHARIVADGGLHSSMCNKSNKSDEHQRRLIARNSPMRRTAE